MMALKRRTLVDRPPACAIAMVVPLAELMAVPANTAVTSRRVMFIIALLSRRSTLFAEGGSRLYISVTSRKKSCFPSRQRIGLAARRSTHGIRARNVPDRNSREIPSGEHCIAQQQCLRPKDVLRGRVLINQRRHVDANQPVQSRWLKQDVKNMNLARHMKSKAMTALRPDNDHFR